MIATHVYYAHRLSRPGALADTAIALAARQITRQLDLRPDQRQELELILDDVREEVRVVRGDVVIRLRELRERAARRFESKLDDEQRQELRRLRAEHGLLLDDYLR